MNGLYQLPPLSGLRTRHLGRGSLLAAARNNKSKERGAGTVVLEGTWDVNLNSLFPSLHSHAPCYPNPHAPPPTATAGQRASNPMVVAFSRWAWFVMHPVACRVQLGCSSCPYPDVRSARRTRVWQRGTWHARVMAVVAPWISCLNPFFFRRVVLTSGRNLRSIWLDHRIWFSFFFFFFLSFMY